MELDFRNELRTEQKQKLTMTPEMVQSLNILKLSGGELIDYITDAMDENPVLDIETTVKDDCRVVEISDAGSTETDYQNISDEWDAMDWYEYSERSMFTEDAYYGRYTYDIDLLERYAYEDSNEEESLAEHLEYQLELCDAPYMIKAVADYIILSLDDNGYLYTPVEEIAEDLNVDIKMVEDARQLVCQFDPAGVGALSLRECLMLQLQAIGRMDEIYDIILMDHMENIAANRLSYIARETGMSLIEIQNRADVIRSLEPKPGRSFCMRQGTRYIIPDVKVKKIQDEYNVFINSVASPKVIIRSEYKEMLKDYPVSSPVADFLSTRFNTAMRLIRALEQRNSTILKVTYEIVKRQRDFFEEGRSGLRPLTMQEVADAISVNESTVSRAVNGKYLLCAQGVYELRYFFASAADQAGDATSEYLKQIIINLVDAEDRRMPLSDRSISEAILVMGIQISRRTVAKYREEIGIPSSSVRRRI